MTPELYAYADAMEVLVGYCDAQNRDTGDTSHFRRAIQDAYREITSSRQWSNLTKTGRVHLQAAYSTGTVTYTSSTRALVLDADGTWPSWARDASVRIGNVTSDITSVSGQTATLDNVLRFRDDIATGSSYELYPRWYTLPNDFLLMSDPLPEGDGWTDMAYVTPGEMAYWTRRNYGAGRPRRWTVRAPDDLLGSMALFVDPPASVEVTLDFSYKRKPRQLRYSGHADDDYVGTITTTAGSDAVVGDGTAFASGMVGSLLRPGSTTARPTGLDGKAPYVEQRVIATVTDATHLTLDANIAVTAAAVGYQISDPVDFQGDLWTALLRVAEKHLANARNFEDRKQAFGIAENAKRQAFRSDVRVRVPRVVGGGIVRRVRLRDLDSGVREE